MADFRNIVPPGACGWLWFLQATDPATDANNHVGPGKLWIETDDDLAPTQIVGAHTWSVDDSAWIDWPIGSGASGGDADTLDGLDSLYFLSASNLASGTLPNARLDAELQALAGLTSAADKGIQFTGSGTAATYDLTAFAKTFLDDANAAAVRATLGVDAAGSATVSDGDKGDIVVSSSGTVWTLDSGVVTAAAKTVLDDATTSDMRTTLGLAIGTNVQAYDAELAALAGLTSAADKVPYFTGSGTAAATDFTSTARSLLDDTSTSAMRTTLGVDASGKQPQTFTFALSDETTTITTGTDKLKWRAPFAFTLTGVRASLSTQSSSGLPTVDINKNTVTVLSTKLTIDASEVTSTTAATAAVISVSSFADDDEVEFDIDVAGTGAKGLKVTLYVTPT